MDLCFDIFAIQILICVACNWTLCSNQMIEFVFNLVLPSIFLFCDFWVDFRTNFRFANFTHFFTNFFLDQLILEVAHP